MMKYYRKKLILLLLILIVICTFYLSGGNESLTLDTIQENLIRIQNYQQSNPLITLSIFSGIYILMTSFSIPGSIVLTLLSGSIFGIFYGSILVTLCGTMGASVSFLMSRYIFQEEVIKRFKDKCDLVNKKLQEDETSYMLFMRLVPISPYVVINVVMGVTKISIWKFAWTTFIGMLPGAFIYVYAGRRISMISSPVEILTWPIALILLLLGLLPFILKKLALSFRQKDYFSHHKGVKL